MKQDIAQNSRTFGRFQDRTERHSDVNSPTYQVHGLVVKDNPKYTKPKLNKPYISDNHLLQTRDIAGAYPGWVNPELRVLTEVKHNTNTQDIEGAQADTVKKNMNTLRCTNPSMPMYQALDGDGVLPPVNISLLPPDLFDGNDVKPAFRVTRDTGPESNVPYLFPDGTTHLNRQWPNLKYDDVSFGNSIPAFDHHPSIPEDVLKVSTFNVHDKKYHRNAMGATKIASATAGVSDILGFSNASQRQSRTVSVDPAVVKVMQSLEATAAAEPLTSKSKISQSEREAIRAKVLVTKDNTIAQEITATPANYDFNNDKTLDMIAKRVLNDNAINAHPVTKGYVQPKNKVVDIDYTNTKTANNFTNMTFKQRKAQSELQAEIAAVRKLQLPDPEPAAPVVVAAPPANAKKGAPAKKK